MSLSGGNLIEDFGQEIHPFPDHTVFFIGTGYRLLGFTRSFLQNLPTNMQVNLEQVIALTRERSDRRRSISRERWRNYGRFHFIEHAIGWVRQESDAGVIDRLSSMF